MIIDAIPGVGEIDDSRTGAWYAALSYYHTMLCLQQTEPADAPRRREISSIRKTSVVKRGTRSGSEVRFNPDSFANERRC
jgi:hypothetical protein